MSKVNGDTGQEAHNKMPLPATKNQLLNFFKKENLYKNKGCYSTEIIRYIKNKVISGFVFFVILIFGINIPDICLIGIACHNIFYRSHRGQHAMVAVIIAMHTISPN